MLLGSTDTRQTYAQEEALIIDLIGQMRYAEAYLLLKKELPHEPSTQYNLALCHYWAGNYQEALICLDKAKTALPRNAGDPMLQNDQFYSVMSQKQNQQEEYLKPISKKFTNLFGVSTNDAIIRLKTDCWLQLGNFSKVIEIATPIASKNYKNIADALQVATNRNTDEQRI
ncbi:tetratricopeptide repeat protein [Mucilaginibacter galii]|uniref:Tetratricopeptide repeat protein n=1 Tax=Mucilaginibacter galii TaxID=2005073 RepID=A0A917N2P6_9SPHI|nr:tetratricopeptide repeat protein [Mucilaginibacter galii]GGI52128.1 hypothetical protein GCM10011425_33400 [Mucilaginibacter galii]